MIITLSSSNWLRCTLAYIYATSLVRAQADVDYVCPSNCWCATRSPTTLDKIQLLCQIEVITVKLDFEVIQARYTTNLYFVCTTDKEGQLADGAFQHLNELEELSFGVCRIGQIKAETFRGLATLKFLNITSINGAVTFHPDALTLIPNLELINLKNQGLHRLPDELFCGLQKLRHLDLAQNHFGSQNDVGFSNDVKDCTFPKLTFLNLMSNNITGLFNLRLSKIAPSLQVLSISRNYIVEINEESFQNLTRLNSLDLSFNQVGHIVPKTFQGLYSLDFLDISGNKIDCLSKELFLDTSILTAFFASHNRLSETCEDNIIFSNVPSLQYLYIVGNNFTELNVSLFHNLAHLEELFLGFNQISRIEPRSFENLREVRIFNLTHNELEEVVLDRSDDIVLFPLLHTLDLSSNKLRDGRIKFGSLPRLQTIRIQENHLQTIPHQFNVSKYLFDMDLSFNNITHISQTDFAGYNAITALLLKGNNVKYIPKGCFQYIPELVELDLSFNDIEILEYQSFNLPRKLTHLDLSHNRIRHPELVFVFMHGLETLNLTANNISVLNQGDFPATLVDVDVSANRIHRIDSNTFNDKPKLHSVRLTMNRLSTLKKEVFSVSPQVTSKPKFYIGTNPFQCDCNLGYLSSLNHAPMPGKDSANYGEIADFHEVFCSFSDRLGNQSGNILDVDPFLCTFDKYCSDESDRCCECCDDRTYTECVCRRQCPENCTCFRSFDYKYVEIVCSSRRLTSIPDIPPEAVEVFLDGNQFDIIISGTFHNNSFMTHLYLNESDIKDIATEAFKGLTELKYLDLRDNEIKDLASGKLMGLSKLTHLKLSNNKLKQITKEIAQRMPNLQYLDLRANRFETMDTNLFGDTNTSQLDTLYLSNNNWSCDCHFGPVFQHWLTANVHIIKDIQYIDCGTVDIKGTDNDTLSVLASDFSGCTQLKSKTVFKMSRMLTTVTAVIAVVFVLISSFIITIFIKRKLIQVWLYSRFGWRIFRAKENIERQFDAFISYSQRDQAVVVEELLPRLEEGNPPYTLCVHFRDWLIGRGIAESVVESVNASKRTILLLSENFIKSEWCNYEFKTAHHRLLQQKTCHVIVILLDDKPPKDLDKELQMYIKTHTYLRYSDPWFWQKLKYALPDVTEAQTVERNEKKRREKEAIEEQKIFLEARGQEARGHHRKHDSYDVEMNVIG